MLRVQSTNINTNLESTQMYASARGQHQTRKYFIVCRKKHAKFHLKLRNITNDKGGESNAYSRRPTFYF
jgi:hypothetical protein